MNNFEISEKDQKSLMLCAERCGASLFTKGNSPAIKSGED
jgi:hypothetical protein